ncbi:MAG: sulfotransferase family protein, partial [Solirubrobacteraceae bacterium]
MNGDERGTPALVVVLAAARSGSSLLRVILDAHPMIGCPGEVGLSALMARLAEAWSVVTATEDANGLHRELPPSALAEVRRAVAALMRAYCRADAKPVFCDKSLESDQYVEMVCALFPDARFLLLFRHVMATVASGLEASTFGFGR